jgi:NAD(P)-dependent dehydrogenase (short-subunit alcohol dehydrogenase family)
VPGDLTDAAACRNLVETTVRELGGIDILANIAGKQIYVEKIEDLTDEQFDQTMKAARRQVEEFGATSPIGRTGQPAELGPVYTFLASPESSYVNGETLVVSGGMPSP